MRLKQGFIFFALCFSFLFGNNLFGAENKSKSDAAAMRNELADLDLQIEYMELKVKGFNERTHSLNQKIKDKQADIADLQNQINQLNGNISRAKLGIEKIQAESMACKLRMTALLTRYKARLVQLHKIKQGTLLSSIFAAKDINSFLNRYEMVKYLLNNDKELLTKLKNEEKKYNYLDERLKFQEKSGEQSKIELAVKEKKIKAETRSLNAMLSALLMEKKIFVQKQKGYAQERVSLKKSLKKLDELIEKQIKEAERLKKEEAAAKAAKEAAEEAAKKEEEAKQVEKASKLAEQRNSTSEESSSGDVDTVAQAAKAMSFAWPVSKEQRGEISVVNKDNPSLIIQVQKDAEIYAAADGEVVYKGSISGLDNVVILKHSRGFSTVYSCLDDVWIGLIKRVDKGTVLGKVAAGKNGLHFEIRFGNKKQNPLDYLPD